MNTAFWCANALRACSTSFTQTHCKTKVIAAEGSRRNQSMRCPVLLAILHIYLPPRSATPEVYKMIDLHVGNCAPDHVARLLNCGSPLCHVGFLHTAVGVRTAKRLTCRRMVNGTHAPTLQVLQTPSARDVLFTLQFNPPTLGETSESSFSAVAADCAGILHITRFISF